MDQPPPTDDRLQADTPTEPAPSRLQAFVAAAREVEAALEHFKAQAEALAETYGDLSEREQALDLRENELLRAAEELAQRESALEARLAECERRERELTAREETLEQLKAACDSVTQALGGEMLAERFGPAVANAETHETPLAPDNSEAPAPPPTPEAESQAGEPPDTSPAPAPGEATASEPDAAPEGSTPQTSQADEESIADRKEEDAELQGSLASRDGDPGPGFACPQETAEFETSATEHDEPSNLPAGGFAEPEPEDPAEAACRVDESRLDPDEARKLRVMRRLTGGKIPDVELLKRIRAERDGDSGPDAENKPRRRWWGG